MTVLQKNAATGVDVGQLGRTLGKALVVGAIAIGVVFAVNSTSGPEGMTPAQFEEANALNKADIGVAEVSTAPFPAGSPTPAYTGRIVTGGAAAAATQTDRADLVFKQKGAALADPADRIHKQKAAELAK